MAALMVAGCATQPYGAGPYGGPAGPYGQPYPPPSAYPQPVGPSPARCPITASRDWRAWVNAMPGPNARPKLMVTGTVLVPTGGHSIAFEPFLQLRESYPAQAFATLLVTRPQGPATQAVTAHDLRWEWPIDQAIGSVEIRCGSDTLATISPVETAQ